MLPPQNHNPLGWNYEIYTFMLLSHTNAKYTIWSKLPDSSYEMLTEEVGCQPIAKGHPSDLGDPKCKLFS